MDDFLSGSTDDLDPAIFARLPFRISRREAARSQLDRAILLWFEAEIADLPAIHTLAVAVQGILTALCRDMKVEKSRIVSWIESKPRRTQEEMRSPQNFFKHGYHKQKRNPEKDVVTYSEGMTEMFLIENVEAYHRLFDGASALMVAYAVWFSFKYPEAFPGKELKQTLAREIDLNVLSKLRKPKFLNTVLPIIDKLVPRRPHLKSP